MPMPANTLLIEGTFDELAEELAVYLDNLIKGQGDSNTSIQADIKPLLEQDQKDEALKKLVQGSAVLSIAPEKEIIAAYNLVIHLVRSAQQPRMFLPRLCQNLSKPITSSPANGTGIALSVLSTIFNTLSADNDARYHVLLTILQVIRNSSNFDTLKPQLKHLDSWLEQWEMEEQESRKLFLAIADAAQDAGEKDTSYEYLIRALRTFKAEDASSQDARDPALRALKAALTSPTHFDFQDLTALDAIQALRKSDPVYVDLLDIFTSEDMEEYNDFNEEHDGWIEGEKLDGGALDRKMRLLTLASLAANAHERSLPYSQIAKQLHVSEEDVEMWVIDVIRAGLVEGKLSQQTKTFLIHRSTYRVFGERQWREVANRLEVWRSSLVGVLQVVRAEKEQFIMQKEQELKEAEGRANGADVAVGRGYRAPVRQQQQQQPVEVE